MQNIKFVFQCIETNNLIKKFFVGLEYMAIKGLVGLVNHFWLLGGGKGGWFLEFRSKIGTDLVQTH